MTRDRLSYFGTRFAAVVRVSGVSLPPVRTPRRKTHRTGVGGSQPSKEIKNLGIKIYEKLNNAITIVAISKIGGEHTTAILSMRPPLHRQNEEKNSANDSSRCESKTNPRLRHREQGNPNNNVTKMVNRVGQREDPSMLSPP